MRFVLHEREQRCKLKDIAEKARQKMATKGNKNAEKPAADRCVMRAMVNVTPGEHDALVVYARGRGISVSAAIRESIRTCFRVEQRDNKEM